MIKKYFFILLISAQITTYGIWTNWTGYQVCNPSQIYYPLTINDLQNYIKNSAINGQTIRAVGSGYSYSDLVCTDGILLNLKYLNHILSLDLKKKRVRVETGITIKELNEQLSSYGLAISNQAATANITLGGALCTAVHGTGHTGTLSSFISEIELITADGTMHVVSPSIDSTIFHAALVSLGALGIMYAVTLQCESLFFLETHEEVMDIEDILANYKKFYNNNDFFQFLWEIKKNKTTIRHWNRCNISDTKYLPVQPQKCFDALAWYTVDNNDKDFTSEIAVPIDLFPGALQKTKQLIETYWQQGMEISEDIVVRFVKADNNQSLSPAANYDVAYINVSAPLEKKYLEFFKDFENAMVAFHGRPHWGKINFITYERALSLYGENLLQFIKVKNSLDPQDVFSNDFIHRICKRL